MNAQMRPPLGEIWGTTEVILPSACTLRDVFTGAQFDPSDAPEALRLRAAELLRTFPVAVLLGEIASSS